MFISKKQLQKIDSDIWNLKYRVCRIEEMLGIRQGGLPSVSLPKQLDMIQDHLGITLQYDKPQWKLVPVKSPEGQ
jgi:hypothetical protein